MLDLLMEHRHGLLIGLMGAGIVGLFVGQAWGRHRHLSRMAEECRHEAAGRKG